ncbi:MAG: c-type cytochrome [Rhodobacteraceae bacterium]|nr:c-type cytochrome [Paracoccaceae bacterium]
MKSWFVILIVATAGVLMVACASRSGSSGGSTGDQTELSGARIYHDQCIRCHGENGQGVAGKYDETLHGERSIESLAKYVARTMPEDQDEKTSPAEAAPSRSTCMGRFIHPRHEPVSIRPGSIYPG